MPTASPQPTIVQLSATVDFNGQNIIISSAIGKDASGKSLPIIFSLTNPVVLGSMDQFIGWAASQFGIPGISSNTVHDALADIPQIPVLSDLINAVDQLFSAVITITVLNINTNTGVYQLGASIDWEFGLFNDLIQFKGIGILVSHGAPITSP